MIAGSVTVWNLFFVGFGYGDRSPDNHAVPIDRAIDALQRYAAQHAMT